MKALTGFVESEVIAGLKKHFPNPRIELNHRNRYELLIVIILSAQTADKKVNEISPLLFSRYPNVRALANADLKDLQHILKPLGFYRRKAAIIKHCAQVLHDEYHSKIPETIEELIQLPGVGRKSASAVLVNAYNKPAIVVDTHVIRLANQRWKLSKSRNPDKIEIDLAKFFSRDNWIFIAKALVLFGRYICTAKKPKCKECSLLQICPYERKTLR